MNKDMIHVEECGYNSEGIYNYECPACYCQEKEDRASYESYYYATSSKDIGEEDPIVRWNEKQKVMGRRSYSDTELFN